MRRRRFLQSATALTAGAMLMGGGTVLGQSALNSGWQATVTTDGLNVRGGPGADQPTVSTLDSGVVVDLLAPSAGGTWWRVAGGDIVGYVSADFLVASGSQSSNPVFDVDLPVAYTRQLSPIWCDPADLEMWMTYHSGGPSNLSP